MSKESFLSEFKTLVDKYKFKEQLSTPHSKFSSQKSKISKAEVTTENRRNARNHKAQDYSYLKSLQPSLATNMTVLFVGYNPSVQSSVKQHRYAHHSNRFWNLFNKSRILEATTLLSDADENYKKLIHSKVSAENDFELINCGIGFTDLILRPTKNAKELTKTEMLENIPRLMKEFETYKPKIICFTGKGIWEIFVKFLLPKTSKEVLSNFKWGKQDLKEFSDLVEYNCIFVVPSTSGLVSIKHSVQLDLWISLADEIKYFQKKNEHLNVDY